MTSENEQSNYSYHLVNDEAPVHFIKTTVTGRMDLNMLTNLRRQYIRKLEKMLKYYEYKHKIEALKVTL